MSEWNVYGEAPAVVVKTVEAKTLMAARRKAKADMSGWFIADDDGITLEDIKITRVENA